MKPDLGNASVGMFIKHSSRRIILWLFLLPQERRKMVNTKNKTKILVECALMIALATVLSKIEIPLWMQGGSITAASMVPIIMVSFRHGTKWGVFTAFTYSIIQMALGFSNVLYCKTLGTQFLCIALDYVVAFTGLGLAYFIGSKIKKQTLSISVGVVSVCFIRFLCSFTSGVVLWSEYATEGMAPWVYSLTYNAGYMIPEAIISVAVAVLLKQFLKPQLKD